MTNWEKEEKHKQSGGGGGSKQAFSLVSRNSLLQRGMGGVGVREEDALSKERTGYNTEEFCPVLSFAFS